MTDQTTQPRPPRTIAARTLVVGIVLVAAGVVLFGAGRHDSSNSPIRTVLVTGSGTVTGVPDTVTFDLGVNTVRATAQEALRVNNRRVYDLKKALHAQGVAKKNVQTSGLNIYQMTDQYGNPTGFSVSDSLQVKMHNLKRAGSAIDAAVAAVGNGISFNGVSFSRSNTSLALAQARTKAMDAARGAASALAHAANLTLGAPLKIVDQENQSSPPPYPLAYASAANGSAQKAAMSTTLSPGTQSVSVQVSVTYQVNP